MIPTAALPHTIQISPLVGVNGLGDKVFGTPVPVHARLVPKGSQVRSAEGTITLADTVAQIRPGQSFPVGSKVTHGSTVYELAEAGEESSLSRPWVTNLKLISPREPQ